MLNRLATVLALVLALSVLVGGCSGQGSQADPVEAVKDQVLTEIASPSPAPQRTLAPTPTPTAAPTEAPPTSTPAPVTNLEPTGCTGRPEGAICWTEAASYVGQYVTAQGKVVKAYDSGSAVFLDFDPDYRQWLYVLIWPQYKERFPGGDPVALYQGRTIQVSGVVELYKGGPEIIVESPDQIRILE